MSRKTRAAAAVAAALAAACAPTSDETLDVYAAASLQEVFEEIADDFESAHPGVSVRLTFAGSSDLATSIEEGAPVDVFASANEEQMERVAPLLDEAPEVFATNELTIAVPAGNPAGITGYEDIAEPSVRLVICAPQVPCGLAAAHVAEALGIEWNPVSEESSVTDVLGKVASGEADAGLVYTTDIARTDVESVPLERADASLTRYPIAAVAASDSRDTAHDFVDFVLSDHGTDVLRDAGFGSP